jgi:glycosyltransferase involved in cell wall biosynthesis
MKVSVIIPVYNVAQEIERCLLSVLNQTWEELEVILVNDCTPDNSMKVAASVIAWHPRGYIVTCLEHMHNQRQGAARNTGMLVATGDYILFVDSDDYLPHDAIATLADGLQNDNIVQVIGRYDIVSDGVAFSDATPLSLPTGLISSNQKILSTLWHEKWYVMPWNRLVKRSFLMENNLFFQCDYHEDNLWTIELACLAEQMAVVNRTTYYYWMRSTSTMHTISRRDMESWMPIIENLERFIEGQGLQGNRLVYMLFEREKAKSFAVILYHTNDIEFQRCVYRFFRTHRYRKSHLLWPGMKLAVCSIHYLLPEQAGYWYYRFFVRLCYYYMLILPYKLKQWSKWIIRK